MERFPNEPTDASLAIPRASANPANDFETRIEDDGVVIVKFLKRNATSVVIPAQIDGQPVVAIAAEAFECCYSLTSVEFPNGLQTIGAYAFLSCYSLTSVEIPNSVASIGDKAFSDCAADLTLYGAAGSAAEEYAAENNLRFEAR